MTHDIDGWEKKVTAAAEHAAKVYNDELDRLEKQLGKIEKHDDRIVARVERQVARDAKFAMHHIEYLERVIDREAKRVDHAYDRIAAKQARGASEEALNRAAEHAVKVEADAEKHVERVIDHVAAGIIRDAKSAARHILKGLEKLDLDEEELDEDVEADADKVAKALADVVKKADA